MGEVFVRDKRVRFQHCDPAGIVFYPQYFVMIHELMEDWFTEALGTDYAALVRDQGRGMPAVKIECEFLAPNPLGDVITFELSVARLGASSVTVLVQGKARGEPCLRATVVNVHSSLHPLKALAFPEALRAKMQRFVGGGPPD
jgi:4-hydroxybenzoyl-CoA thioesterase